MFSRQHLLSSAIAISIAVSWLVLCDVHGQVIGLERGSVSAAIAAERNQARVREEFRAWKNAKKLTLQKEIPDEPRDDYLDPEFLKEDSFGYLECFEFEVLQVVGDSEVLLKIQNPSIPAVWLTGYPTKGIVDGEKIRLVGPIEVGESKSYTTVLGAKKTLRTISFITEDRHATLLANRESKAKAKKQAERHAAEEKLFKKWTSVDKKYTVEAKFIKFEKGTVFLEQRDGVVRRVKITKLCREDQLHCRNLVKSIVKAKKLKKNNK